MLPCLPFFWGGDACLCLRCEKVLTRDRVLVCMYVCGHTYTTTANKRVLSCVLLCVEDRCAVTTTAMYYYYCSSFFEHRSRPVLGCCLAARPTLPVRLKLRCTVGTTPLLGVNIMSCMYWSDVVLYVVCCC